MSRTYRKPKSNRTLVQEINRDIAWASKTGYETILVKKDPKQYRNEVAQRDAEFAEKVAAYYKKYPTAMWHNLDYPRYVSRFERYEMPISLAKIEKEAREDYAKQYREGNWNETGRNKYFKWLCKNTVRNAYKNLKNDWEKYDNISYPDEHIGDGHRWSVW